MWRIKLLDFFFFPLNRGESSRFVRVRALLSGDEMRAQLAGQKYKR